MVRALPPPTPRLTGSLPLAAKAWLCAAASVPGAAQEGGSGEFLGYGRSWGLLLGGMFGRRSEGAWLGQTCLEL